MEQWQEWTENPMYLISSHGRVITLYKSSLYGPTGGMLSLQVNNMGYHKIFLTIPKKGYYQFKKNYSVHRVVADVYIPNPDNKPEVNHIDGDKLNNHVDNLEWVTHQENIQASYDTGQRKYKSGPEHHMYGNKASTETKRLMRMSKLGKRHPKYKGYYQILGRRFYSSRVAGEVMNVSGRTIMRRCVNPKFMDYSFVLDPAKTG